MTPEQIKQLRSGLRCTARELATTLGVPLAEVQAWEAGEQFPTKQWVQRMELLNRKGPDGIVRKVSKTSRASATPMAQLDNPEVWRVFRKLLANPQLLAQVTKLAESYDDPAATNQVE